MVTRDEVYEVLAEVKDPEIPALSVLDMAIVRDVELVAEQVKVTITPTYSGCPAMKMIEEEIVSVLQKAGIASVQVESVLSPAWTTDWMSEEAKRKLVESGISPPCCTLKEEEQTAFTQKTIPCPYCKSRETSLTSEFGSTACKALYKCQCCGQPFDYFKVI